AMAESDQESPAQTSNGSDAEAELAAQIAEDQALEAQLRAEDAAEDNAPSPLLNSQGELDQQEVESSLEALLFMSDKPLSTRKLHELLGPEFGVDVFETALTSLVARYRSTAHGFELLEIAGGWQFRTKPGKAALARKLAKIQTQRLSSGALETL